MAYISLDLSAETIPFNDLICRFEQLENLQPENVTEKWDMCEDYAVLLELLYENEGKGDSVEWRGKMYPAQIKLNLTTKPGLCRCGKPDSACDC